MNESIPAPAAGSRGWPEILQALADVTGARMGRITFRNRTVAKIGLDETIPLDSLPPAAAEALHLPLAHSALGEFKASLFFAEPVHLSESQMATLRTIVTAAAVAARNEVLRTESDEFVRGFIHDVKGHSARATSFSQLLGTHALSPPAAELASNISRSLLPLDRFFREAAAFVSAGSPPLEWSVVPLDSIFDDVRYQMRKTIEMRGAQVDFAGGGIQYRLPAAELADVLGRLVDNALKFSGPDPYIRIWAEQQDASLGIFVQDNGPGICSNDVQTLFLPFRRLHSDRIEGFGLGLSICRRHIEAAGGRIGIAAAGPGTTVEIWLPKTSG